MMALSVASFAGGCATDPCLWVEPINPSRADVLTEGTQRQILEHNKTGAAECGWRPLS